MIVALLLPVLAGFVGMATEAGLWFYTHQTMQAAADAAAFSAAKVAAGGGNWSPEALAVAAAYGFVDGANGTAVTALSPPQAGAHKGESGYYEVFISQTQKRLFSALFTGTPLVITARAIAGNIGTPGDGCVLALDRGNVTDVLGSGGATLNLNDCSLYSDSPSSRSVNLSGGAVINAASASIAGNYVTSGGGRLSATNGVTTSASPASDPYAGVQIPVYSGCGGGTSLSVSGGTTRNLQPGVYCNGITVSGASTLNLSPGIYIVDRGSFVVSGGSTINAGGGVTIILTSSTGSGYASASISGGSTVNITAPASGPTAGLAFFQDRNAPTTGADNLSGGATQNITGAIYFPNQAVTYSGGSATGGAQCTQLIAYTLTFSGGTNFNSTCSGTGVQAIGGSAGSTALVE
jgi:Putative Flp pilus-assembly TadE/G-like